MQLLWGFYSAQIAVIAGYVGPAMTGQVDGLPALYNYECGIATLDPNRSIPLQHDLWYHPEMHYSTRSDLQAQQDGDFRVPGSGAQLSCLFTWGGIWGNGLTFSVPIFNKTVFGSQPLGTGRQWNIYTTHRRYCRDHAQGTGNGFWQRSLRNQKRNCSGSRIGYLLALHPLLRHATTTSGTATQLGIHTQPSPTAMTGIAFAQQPIIYIEDVTARLSRLTAQPSSCQSLASGSGLTLGHPR